MFEKIYGYQKVKEEVERVIDWFVNRDKYKDLNVTIPKGFIFYGFPGCGKTLFLKGIKEKYQSHVVVLDGGDNSDDFDSSFDVVKEIDKVFDQASKMDYGIILIDELDLLLDGRKHYIRELQTHMDGIESYDNVMVIAASNSISDFYDSLLRPGRFDRKIKVERPNKKDRHEILRNTFKVKNINISEEDINYLADILDTLTCAEIVAIINDAVLRNFGKNITTELIEESYHNYYYGSHLYEEEDIKEKKFVALHEAGHALLVNKHRNYFNFYKATIKRNGDSRGMCKVYEVDENDQSLLKYVANNEIKLAGYIANKIIYNHMESGASEDLKDAIYNERVLVNSMGYKGIKYTLRQYVEGTRNETDSNCHRNELVTAREIRKLERSVTKYIKSNKELLMELANKLEENGTLSRKEFEEITSKYNN